MDRFDWIEVKQTHKDAPASDDLSGSDRQPFALARQLRAAGHFKSAVARYEEAVGLESTNYQAWRELIDTLVRARQIKHASRQAHELRTLYPDVVEMYASHALVLLHNKKIEEAKDLVKQGYAAGDRSWYLSCVQTEIILQDNSGYSREALSCLEKATMTADNPWEAYFIGGWILLDVDLPTWAAGYFAEAGHRNPTAPIIWLCLGDCFKELRLYDQAMFYYQKAAELEPRHALALKRQRNCAPRLYGLMRIFKRDSIQRRWNREFNDRMKSE